jgi:hypothetical protein
MAPSRIEIAQDQGRRGHSRDGTTPSERAHYAGRMAETIFRALSSAVADRWKFVSFRGANGGEPRGVVDVVAIRRDMMVPEDVELRRGDLFEIVLIQLKGGQARWPNEADRRRLRRVAKRYGKGKIVLYEHRQQRRRSTFYELNGDNWQEVTREALFGKNRPRR